MNLFEAKEILKKNGYELVEAYDAVTDRNNIKDRRNRYWKSYFSKVELRICNALKENGIECRLRKDDSISIGEYVVDARAAYLKTDHVGGGKLGKTGTESGEFAGDAKMENEVKLVIFKNDKILAAEEFDVRNTPSMVEWILDNIENEKVPQ